MHYRGMVIDDYEQLLALWQDTEGVGLRDSDSVDGIRRYLERNPQLSFVAERDGCIVGTVMAGHDGKRGYVQHLTVAENCRRQGVGRQLTKLCLDALAARGILKAHVHVYAHNESGRRFWEGYGWHPRDELVIYSYVSGDNRNI